MPSPNPKACIALITARGGSKGLPGKNIKHLHGKPLIAYTIEAALESQCFDAVYVSTDCDQIAQCSTDAGAHVIRRPERLSTDSASSIDVLLHAFEVIPNIQDRDLCVLLQPTSPLRSAKHIQQAIALFHQIPEAKSLISVSLAQHHPYKSFTMSAHNAYLEPLMGAQYMEKPRQDLPVVYQPNGAIFMSRIVTLSQTKSFVTPPILPYVMSAECSIDIDTALDFALTELLLKNDSV